MIYEQIEALQIEISEHLTKIEGLSKNADALKPLPVIVKRIFEEATALKEAYSRLDALANYKMCKDFADGVVVENIFEPKKSKEPNSEMIFEVTQSEYEAIHKLSQTAKPGSIVGYRDANEELVIESAPDKCSEKAIIERLNELEINKYFTLCAGKNKGGYLYGFENGFRVPHIEFVIV